MNQPAMAETSQPMEFDIVAKGIEVEIKDKQGAAFTRIYLGAGWDTNSGAAVDLDLVAACLTGGKLTSQTRLIYFGDKDEPGIRLSEDNTTGEGDGDDENMVIDLTQVEADVDSIAIGLVAYSGADLSSAKNVHFRVVNGSNENDPQVFDVTIDMEARSGDTVLHAANLKRGDNGWTIENVTTFHQKGTGNDAVKGFASLFA